MSYTVKKLAVISGVSVRTLHWYDEVGLLRPSARAVNGYRLYEEEQLLTLQQILFYRELGFELRQIKRVLSQDNLDRIKALDSHRQWLCQNVRRTQQLIATIDNTIQHLKGTRKMKAKEMFEGFDPKQQAKYEQYLIDRYGEEMKEGIKESKTRVKDWTKARWEQSAADFSDICRKLVALLEQRSTPESQPVQQVIRLHFIWLKQFWTPNRESYAGHSQLIESSELRKAYEAYHPELPKYVAMAIHAFAEKELT